MLVLLKDFFSADRWTVKWTVRTQSETTFVSSTAFPQNDKVLLREKKKALCSSRI
jgi:hypothetical protein